MASGMYNRFKYNLLAGECYLGGDSPHDVIRVALMDSNHSFVATHNVWAEVSGNELAAAGNYTQGGEILLGQSVTQGATTKWDAVDVEWNDATFTARHAVIYDDSLGGDDLIGSIDFGEDKPVSAGTFKIQWHVNGIVTLAAA